MGEDIHKKIVVDENNKPVEVIISYAEWEKIERIIGKGYKSTTAEMLSEFAGTLSLKEDPLEYQKRIRNEWQ